MTRNNISPHKTTVLGYYVESNLNLGAIITASTTCSASAGLTGAF